MKAAILARLKRLEELCPVKLRPPEFQIGYLEKLAPDYIGERHIVTGSRDPMASTGWKSGQVRRRLMKTMASYHRSGPRAGEGRPAITGGISEIDADNA